MNIMMKERLTFEVFFSVWHVVNLLRENERGDDHVTDGQVTERDVCHRSHVLDLRYDENDAHVAEETAYKKRRYECREGRLPNRQTHLTKLLSDVFCRKGFSVHFLSRIISRVSFMCLAYGFVIVHSLLDAVTITSPKEKPIFPNDYKICFPEMVHL